MRTSIASIDGVGSVEVANEALRSFGGFPENVTSQTNGGSKGTWKALRDKASERLPYGYRRGKFNSQKKEDLRESANLKIFRLHFVTKLAKTFLLPEVAPLTNFLRDSNPVDPTDSQLANLTFSFLPEHIRRAVWFEAI